MTLDGALAVLLDKKQQECNHPQQEITEVVPGILHCWVPGCGKEWKK